MADERDPKLSKHYRELEPLEPPAALDRKILAAAREATESHAPLVVPAGRHRWYYSLAAAAVLVFAVAITLHVERDRPDIEMSAAVRGEIKQAPKAETAPPAQAEHAPAFTPDPQANATREATPARPALSLRTDEPGAAMERMRVEQAAAEAKAAADIRARHDMAERQQAPRAARSMAAPAAPAPERQSAEKLAAQRQAAGAPAPTPSAAQIAATAPENPERWLERIAELRSRGRHADADRELVNFRKAYPNYQLSDLMRERVEGTPAPAAQ